MVFDVRLVKFVTEAMGRVSVCGQLRPLLLQVLEIVALAAHFVWYLTVQTATRTETASAKVVTLE